MRNVKRTMLLVGLLTTMIASKGQGIFSQKAGQIKNMIKQVALLQVYIGYVEKGYSIAREGLTTIGDIKRGDLHLHVDYFNKLKTVNPSVRKYSRVAEIIAQQLAIIKENKKTLQSIHANPLFSVEERGYIERVFSGLLDGCATLADELLELTSTGVFAMKDDERMQRIDRLAADMQDKYAFAKVLGQELGVLGLQKSREQQEVSSSRLLNNIK